MDHFDAVPCGLCRVDDTRPFKRKQGMFVVQCNRCGLVYVNPRPTEQYLREHYNNGCSSRIQYYRDVECADRKTFEQLLNRINRLKPLKGRLLDVGPNIGTCLDVARSHSWDVTGIEINAEAAIYCRDQRGLSVLTGVLDNKTFDEASFDVVVMGDVIEHLPDPLAVMKVVRDILKPDGLVLISTPNIATLAGRVLQIKPVEHLYYFSPDTMSRLLGKAGFDRVAVESYDRYHNLTALTHSTTLGGLFQTMAPVIRLTHRLLGDVVARLPIRENLLAFAQRPSLRPTETSDTNQKAVASEYCDSRI